ncbi:hypothetical protein C0585_05660 [Candidatus Woesearchaeota archaeon]|nr:MAG: hypothetical protein C0585_05660 [Candidatus Woesearchaeota archaeon]
MARKTSPKQLRRMVNIGRKRAPRPKTFKTEEAAKAYAKEKGIKDFELDPIRADKIRILTK